jgi:hypothetical protein
MVRTIKPQDRKALEKAEWGNHYWYVMRTVASEYPDRPTHIDVDKRKAFFESMTHCLPCPTCRANYEKHIAEVPLSSALENKTALKSWVEKIYALTEKDKTAHLPPIPPVQTAPKPRKASRPASGVIVPLPLVNATHSVTRMARSSSRFTNPRRQPRPVIQPVIQQVQRSTMRHILEAKVIARGPRNYSQRHRQSQRIHTWNGCTKC